MDQEGYFYIVERKKDIIKYKGYVIFPSEVERIISEYEPVKEVAVVGSKANEIEYGQVVKAFIVMKDNYKDTITKDDIINYCKDKLAYIKIPKDIQFIQELPKNAMGKVIRKQLKTE